MEGVKVVGSLYDPDLELYSAVTSLDGAAAIDTAGQIVGRGWNHDRQLHFGLLAVPKN
jgi:hypothetical protein